MKRNLTSITILFIVTCILQASDKPAKLRKDDIPRNEKQMWARIDAMQEEVEDNLLSHDQRFLDELELARRKVADIMLTSESDKKDKKAVQELRQRTWTFWTRTVSEVEVEDVKEYNLNTALGQRAPVAQVSSAQMAPWQDQQGQSDTQQDAPVGSGRTYAARVAPPVYQQTEPVADNRPTAYPNADPNWRVNAPCFYPNGSPMLYERNGASIAFADLSKYVVYPPYAAANPEYSYVQFGYTHPRPVRIGSGGGGNPVKSYPKKGQGYVGSGRTTSASSGRHK
jgi:hypothetical protein